jgi:methyl-accepting chemotaxis protein
MTGAEGNTGFLPLTEAAARLGVSRLKLREAIAKGVIVARRDNEGRWRVDLAAMPADLRAATAGPAPDPAALMEALFDEIEELSADLEESQGTADRLTQLAGAQGAALERTVAALEQTVAERDRLAAMTGRALAAAEEAEARAAALQATADRAIGLLDRTTAAMDAMQGQVARLQADAGAKEQVITAHAGQLDRLFTLSEQALEQAGAARRRGPGLIARVLGVGAGRRE